MAHPITSKRRAQILSTALFLLALATLIVIEQWQPAIEWWPAIMLVVGLPLALRQYLLGRNYDMTITLLIFVGTFITVEFDISWRIFLPSLLTIGAIYILIREWTDSNEETEEEKEENSQHEIEEDKK